MSKAVSQGFQTVSADVSVPGQIEGRGGSAAGLAQEQAYEASFGRTEATTAQIEGSELA